MKFFTIIIAIVISILFFNHIKTFVLKNTPIKLLSRDSFYSTINISQPSIHDYHLLQEFLEKGKRSELKALKDYESRVRKIRLIGRSSHQTPQQGLIAVNCSEDEKENCLIVYASFNKWYPMGLKRLVDHVAHSDFKGHILFRLGGWPNVEGGDLKLAHVPYAFKPCFFREAKRLGYKKVLWLDASIVPLVSLNQIFQGIEEKGYFAMDSGWMVGPFLNQQVTQALGITLEEGAHIQSCSAGLFGVDFAHPIASKVADEWYQKAHDPVAFFSPRSDQTVLSILLYQHGLQDFTSIKLMAHPKEEISDQTLFIIDRGFVNQK